MVLYEGVTVLQSTDSACAILNFQVGRINSGLKMWQGGGVVPFV